MWKKTGTIAAALLVILFLASVATAQQRRGNTHRKAPDGRGQPASPGNSNHDQTPGNGNQDETPGNGNQDETPGNPNQDETPGGDSSGGTPDGTTPAEESTCDDLKHGTPGLYGLCIAFCEAHDCVPDYSQEFPFSNCKKNDRKILDKYNQKRRDGDPDMPCLPSAGEDPATACPCWSQNQLAYFPYTLSFPVVGEPWMSCGGYSWEDEDGGETCQQSLSYIGESGTLSSGTVIHFDIAVGRGDCDGTSCQGNISCEGGPCPEGFQASDVGVDITDAEYLNCEEQLRQLQASCY